MRMTPITKTILICGSRDYSDKEAVRAAILQLPDAFLHNRLRVVHGDSRGADTLAKEVCEDLYNTGEYDIYAIPYPANWSIGKAAGPIRNQRMLDEESDIEIVIAFGAGKGTSDMIQRAAQKGIKIRRYP